MMGKAGRRKRLLITIAVKRIPQLVATFLILDLAKVFYTALVIGGIQVYQQWGNYSWVQILKLQGWGFFGDDIWILAIELFLYVPIALYWVFREDLKRLKRFVMDYRKEKED